MHEHAVDAHRDPLRRAECERERQQDRRRDRDTGNRLGQLTSALSTNATERDRRGHDRTPTRPIGVGLARAHCGNGGTERGNPPLRRPHRPSPRSRSASATPRACVRRARPRAPPMPVSQGRLDPARRRAELAVGKPEQQVQADAGEKADGDGSHGGGESCRSSEATLRRAGRWRTARQRRGTCRRPSARRGARAAAGGHEIAAAAHAPMSTPATTRSAVASSASENARTMSTAAAIERTA